MNKCPTPNCRNKVTGNYQCSKCRSKKYREANPVKYAFNNLRNRARQRGVLFTITFEDFKEWCVKINYIGMAKGRGANSFTVDRRHNDVGYHLDNIQVLTRRENIIKYFSYDYRSKQAVAYEAAPMETQEEELPF